MKCMRFAARLACLAALAGLGLLAIAPAMASPITWAFKNISSREGSTVTGSFTFNSGTFSNVNLTLNPSGGMQLTTTSDFPYQRIVSLGDLQFSSNSVIIDLFASRLAANLSTAGTINIAFGKIDSGTDFHYMETLGPGELVSVAQTPPVTTTPEPGTWALLGTGGLMLLGLGYARQRGAERTVPTA